jgi:hypothetical protein
MLDAVAEVTSSAEQLAQLIPLSGERSRKLGRAARRVI